MADLTLPERPLQQRSEFGFEPFTEELFYLAVNDSLIDLLVRSSGKGLDGIVLGDIACGTGLLTKRVLEKGHNPALSVLVDNNAPMLELAREKLAPYTSRTSFEFYHADVQHELPGNTQLDIALVGNSVHLFPSKDAALEVIAARMKPGGYLAVNTTFFAGFQVPGSDHFWYNWIKEAIAETRKQKLPFARDKGDKGKMEWLDATQYEDLFTRNGFRVVAVQKDIANLGASALEKIAGYHEFVQGALRPQTTGEQAQVYMASAAQALKSAVACLFQKYDIEAIPRFWLQIVAQKV